MDVYRNFRRHFAQVKGILPDKNSAAQSPGSKARKIASDVILGLQPLTLLTGEQDEQASNVTRLFVIPSTSGLAAGYSVSSSEPASLRTRPANVAIVADQGHILCHSPASHVPGCGESEFVEGSQGCCKQRQ